MKKLTIIGLGLITLALLAICNFSLEGLLMAGCLAATAAPGVVLTEDQVKQWQKILGDIEGDWSKVKTLPDLVSQVQKQFDEIRDQVKELRKGFAKRGSFPANPRAGFVSEDCARFIGAIAVERALRKGVVKGDWAERHVCQSFEIQSRTALTTTDIPLPDIYSSEVSELVYQYGQARQYGTVYPLGGGSVKLPRLKTDTTFGLLSMSTAITQKSPQIEFVTMAAEKYGGLILLPTEIDEDSVVAMGQFLARYGARNIARAEDYLYFRGNGTTDGDPEGLCVSTITDSDVYQQASTKTHYSDMTLDYCRSLRAEVSGAVLGSSAYYFHPTFEQKLVSFNTSSTVVPYRANGISGASLDGFPIRWISVLPAYDTSAHVSTVFALFGDLTWQYLGVRGGVRYDISDQAGFATDDLYVRCLERFTIGKMATTAIAGLETAAS